MLFWWRPIFVAQETWLERNSLSSLPLCFSSQRAIDVDFRHVFSRMRIEDRLIKVVGREARHGAASRSSTRKRDISKISTRNFTHY